MPLAARSLRRVLVCDRRAASLLVVADDLERPGQPSSPFRRRHSWIQLDFGRQLDLFEGEPAVLAPKAAQALALLRKEQDARRGEHEMAHEAEPGPSLAMVQADLGLALLE